MPACQVTCLEMSVTICTTSTANASAEVIPDVEILRRVVARRALLDQPRRRQVRIDPGEEPAALRFHAFFIGHSAYCCSSMSLSKPLAVVDDAFLGGQCRSHARIGAHPLQNDVIGERACAGKIVELHERSPIRRAASEAAFTPIPKPGSDGSARLRPMRIPSAIHRSASSRHARSVPQRDSGR